MSRYPKDRGPTPRELLYMRVVKYGGSFPNSQEDAVAMAEQGCFDHGWVELNHETCEYQLTWKGEQYVG
jgi:hypothetical protein